MWIGASLGAVIVLVVDRALKQWALFRFLGTNAAIVNSRSFFFIEIPQSVSQQLSGIVLCIAIVVVVMMWRSLDREYQKKALAPFILFLGGSASNVADRFVYGGVVDMIPFFSLSLFNIADAALVVGALSLFCMLWRQKSIRERS